MPFIEVRCMQSHCKTRVPQNFPPKLLILILLRWSWSNSVHLCIWILIQRAQRSGGRGHQLQTIVDQPRELSRRQDGNQQRVAPPRNPPALLTVEGAGGSPRREPSGPLAPRGSPRSRETSGRGQEHSGRGQVVRPKSTRVVPKHEVLWSYWWC